MSAKKTPAKKSPTKKAPAKKKAVAKKKKVAVEKKPKGPAKFDFKDFKTELEKTVKEKVRDKKKVGSNVKVLSFSSENVVGHVTGYISTRSIAIDAAIGMPGVPLGRITEVTGEDSTGKTTLAAHLIAECQAMGGVAFVVDTEDKMDVKYTEAIGVNTDDLITIQPDRKTFNSVLDSLSFIFDYINEHKLQNTPTLCVWDSVASTCMDDEYTKDNDEGGKVGGASKQLSRAMRVLTGRIAKANTAFFIVNHNYTNIVTGFAARFSSSTKVSFGGKAIRHSACLRLYLTKMGQGSDITLPDGRLIGNYVKCTPIKNQIAKPRQDRAVAVTWGVGFDNTIVLFDRLKELKHIEARGGWLYIKKADGEEKAFQHGFLGLGKLFFEDPDLRKHCETIYHDSAHI